VVGVLRAMTPSIIDNGRAGAERTPLPHTWHGATSLHGGAIDDVFNRRNLTWHAATYGERMARQASQQFLGVYCANKCENALTLPHFITPGQRQTME